VAQIETQISGADTGTALTVDEIAALFGINEEYSRNNPIEVKAVHDAWQVHS
jgi:hypothetical protein